MAENLTIASWIWYGVAALVVALRLISRTLHLKSLRNLQVDDYLMVVVVAIFTAEIITLNLVGSSASNLLPPGYLDTHTLSHSDISDREYGSKLVLVVEQCQCAVVWLCKAGLATMYLRITSGLPRRYFWVKALIAYVAITYVVMEILYLGVWCRPIYNYWAVPTPNIQCSAATNHLITNFVFNLTSDIAFLCIGVPLFITSKLPLKRKLIITGVFCLGLFNMTCAVLNKYYSFTQPYGNDWTFWYLREAATAILVANLPFMWTLLRRVCGLKTWVASAAGNSNPRQRVASLAMKQRSSAHRPSIPWRNTASTTRATADTDDENEGLARKWWRGGGHNALQSSMVYDDEETMIGSPSGGPDAHDIFKTVEVSVTNTTIESDGDEEEFGDWGRDAIFAGGSSVHSTRLTSTTTRPSSIRAERTKALNLAFPQHALTTTSRSEALAARTSSRGPLSDQCCNQMGEPAILIPLREPDFNVPAGEGSANVPKTRRGSWARWWAS